MRASTSRCVASTCSPRSARLPSLARLRDTAVGVMLAVGGLSALATQLAHAQGADGSRAVIGVFPIAAPGLENIPAAKLQDLTGKLHHVIATGSGFLTVPRAAIRKALERGGHAEVKGEKSIRDLEAAWKAAENEAQKASQRVEAATEAQEIAPDSHEGRAAHAVFLAEEKAARAKIAAVEAKAAYDQAVELAQQMMTGGKCSDDACRAAIGRVVGASKVTRSTFAPAPGATGAKACDLTIRFYDIESGFVDLIVEASGTCDEAGLNSAIETVAMDLKTRDDAGFDVFKIDLAEGKKIKNPPTTETGDLSIFAAAKGDKNEVIEVWLNGDKVGDLAGGQFAKKVPRGRYVVVLKPRSNLFNARRFDLEVSARAVRVPLKGTVMLAPVFGAIAFELVDGPWALRSGQQPLVQRETNQVRPGQIPVQLYLGDDPVGEVNVTIAPSQTAVVRVTERPLTRDELSGKRAFWNWRRWGSLALAVGAAGVGGERLASAHGSADKRDTALSALSETSQAAAYEQLRRDVINHDDDRGNAQVVALSLFGAAGAFAVWSALEFVLGEPDPGKLVAPGLEVVPVSDIGPADDDNEKIKIEPAKKSTPGAPK